MNEEQTFDAEAAVSVDDLVKAAWGVTVSPGRNVSINYRIEPISDSDAVTSVTASFVVEKDGVVVDTLVGSTSQDLINPRDGQGMAGDVGADIAAFRGEYVGQTAAILAGTVRYADGTANFFFKKPFSLTS